MTTGALTTGSLTTGATTSGGSSSIATTGNEAGTGATSEESSANTIYVTLLLALISIFIC